MAEGDFSAVASLTGQRRFISDSQVSGILVCLKLCVAEESANTLARRSCAVSSEAFGRTYRSEVRQLFHCDSEEYAYLENL